MYFDNVLDIIIHVLYALYADNLSQENKLTNPKKSKVKCSACKIMVHSVCINQLYYTGYYCKHTFREIKQKVKDVSATVCVCECVEYSQVVSADHTAPPLPAPAQGPWQVQALRPLLGQLEGQLRPGKWAQSGGGSVTPVLQDIIGYSCSWCGDSYHEACYREAADALKRESCHLGPLRNMIVPPSWIVKVPPWEQQQVHSDSWPALLPNWVCFHSNRLR